MKKRRATIIIVVSLLIIFALFALINHQYKLDKIQKCIDKVLQETTASFIIVKPNYQGKKPMLEGLVSANEKYLITEGLTKQCGISDFFDYLDIKVDYSNKSAWIRYIVDDYNSHINIHGLVKSEKQLNEILTVFKRLNLTTIANDVTLNSAIPANDLSLTLSLLIPAIERVHVQDIKITRDTIRIKGIVRNQPIAVEIIHSLKEIFDEDYEIINAIEYVDKLDSTIEKIEIEPLKPIFL